MKKSFWMVSLVLAATLAACASAPIATPPPPAATATEAAPVGLVLSGGVVASAEAVPTQVSQISSVIPAPVQEVLVKEGDEVKAGQTLLTLYSPSFELALTSAELDFKAAELEFQYWIPPRHNRPPERRQQAAAELEESRLKLETAKANLTQTSLIAPFDAVVVEVKIQPGQFAQAGQVVIILGDLAHMQIKTTDLSERDVLAVQTGQTTNIYIEALDVTVTGRVLNISPMSETVGGDVVFPVKIEMDKQPEGLLWGMNAEVEIQTK